MKKNSVASWPTILPESSLVKYNPERSQKRSSGVVKMMPSIPPPDDKTIRDLNSLAAAPPFCFFRKARRHDTL
jgi:hypothetical protein